MPLFTFECQDCSEDFEELVSFSQSSNEIACPNCRSRNTHKKLSLVARMSPAASNGAVYNPTAAACSPGGT